MDTSGYVQIFEISLVSTKGIGKLSNEILTHNANKEVSEDEWANPDPEQDVSAGKGNAGDLGQIIVDFVPLIQCEQLKQSDHRIQ